MKTFKQFLKEEYHPTARIHVNPNPAALKNLVDRSSFGELRYVITKKNDVHVGDGAHFEHTDLHPQVKNWHSKGWIVKKDHGYSFEHQNNEKYGQDPGKHHPFLDRMKKRGIKKVEEY